VVFNRTEKSTRACDVELGRRVRLDLDGSSGDRAVQKEYNILGERLPAGSGGAANHSKTRYGAWQRRRCFPDGENEVEQPVARAEHDADGDPVELASYVPALVARRFADRREPLVEPESERFPAAVLFADISGFTALTERLAGTGPNGVEELTELLNDCFGELVELSERTVARS
jgi:hypothetical protein